MGSATMKLLWIAPLLITSVVLSVDARRGGGGRGPRECSDGSAPTCSDGAAPVPPCADGGKPRTCPDGSRPRGRGRNKVCSDGSSPTCPDGGRPTKCDKDSVICCDGSTPVFDKDKSTPPCTDGSKPVCSQVQCNG